MTDPNQQQQQPPQQQPEIEVEILEDSNDQDVVENRYDSDFGSDDDDNYIDDDDDDEFDDAWNDLVIGFINNHHASIHHHDQPPSGPIEADVEQLNYDITLPIAHSYLGGLEAIDSGRKLFPINVRLNMKLIYLNGIFLVPTQEIPLTFHNRLMIDFFRDIINNGQKTFGVGIGSVEDRFGTTAEIRSFSVKKDGQEMTIKVEGRQRFKIIETSGEGLGEFSALIEIMPEVNIFEFERPLLQTERYLWSQRSLKSKLSILTSNPGFVLDFYDNHCLMQHLKTILSVLIESRVKNENFSYPIDPGTFSYFVLMAIPFPDMIKIRLLMMDCVNQRLRLEYALLSVNFAFVCSSCQAKLCDRQSFLVMSKQGNCGTFVNSFGVIHELYTFSKIDNITRVSDLNEEYTWFPDYGWIIIRCRGCRTHLGWEYRTKKADIHPQVFWGLTRNSIRLSFEQQPELKETLIYKVFEVELEDEFQQVQVLNSIR